MEEEQRMNKKRKEEDEEKTSSSKKKEKTSSSKKSLTCSIEPAEYDIDGLVLSVDEYFPNSEEQKYKVAYKEDIFAETLVLNVEWRATSKDAFLNPRIHIQPVFLLGKEIKKITGKNAKFIVDNKIGKNAKVLVSFAGDTIPDVVEVLEGSEEKDMIYPEGELGKDYEWDENHVKFRLLNFEDNEGVQKSKIKYFMTHMKVAEMGPANIDTLYNKGFNTLSLLFSMKPDDIMDIPGFAAKSAITICTNIKNSITNVSLYKVMAASTVFGRNFAEERIQMILNHFDINSVDDLKQLSYEDPDDLIEKIMDIDRFAETLSTQFVENLPLFIDWIDEHKQIKIRKEKEKKKTGEKNKWSGKLVVFTGLRPSNVTLYPGLAQRMEELDIKEKENGITKSVDLLVGTSKDIEKKTEKVKKAEKYGIKIMNVQQFMKELNI